jgi:AraC family transcriptional regulator
MQFRVETIPSKKLLGFMAEISMLTNTTPLLWKNLMPRQKEIINRVGSNFYSMQIYHSKLELSTFTPQTRFQNWAMLEVSTFENLQTDMKTHTLVGGMYAVFDYKGTPANMESFARKVFGEIIPQSKYEVDEREHFQLLGEKYKRDSEDSEEEFWIPIKFKVS